jgi:hypothetical protein
VGALPGAPPISIAAHLFSQDSYDQNIAAFTSQFIALSSAIKPVAGEPSAVWVTVIWQPSNPSVATARQLRSQLKQLPVVVGDIEVSETTVGGQPAAFAQNDLSAVTNLHLRDTSYRYGGLLTWLTPSGALLAVEAHSFTPVDVAVLRRIGAGLVLGQQPPSTPPPT